jgi:phosphomannomutase/phosphoglucomutase
LTVEPGDRRQAIVHEIQSAFADHPQRLTDGVRIDFANGWGLVRSSVTDSRQLTFRFEGDSEGALAEVVKSFCDALPGLGAELYRLYKGES